MKGHAAAAAAQNEEGGISLALGERPDTVLSRPRTDALLLRLSLVVGREVFYAALWGSVLASPSIRLPASLFVVGHINRGMPGREQKYMLGTDYQLTVGALAGGGGRADGHHGEWRCSERLGRRGGGLTVRPQWGGGSLTLASSHACSDVLLTPEQGPSGDPTASAVQVGPESPRLGVCC